MWRGLHVSRLLALVAVALAGVCAVPAPAGSEEPEQPPPLVLETAGDASWLVYSIYDRFTYETLSVTAVDRSGRAKSLPLRFGHADVQALTLIGDVLTGQDPDPRRIIWMDIRTGARGSAPLSPNDVFIAGTPRGWLLQGSDGLVQADRLGHRQVIDADPGRDLRPFSIEVSAQGFSAISGNAVTYRTWREIHSAHVIKPPHRSGEQLECFDLSTKAISCVMRKVVCENRDCDTHQTTRNRPYYIPLPDGPPVRSPLEGYVTSVGITLQTPSGDFETWNPVTGEITTAPQPQPEGEWLFTAGRALRKLVLTNTYGTKLLVARPDMTQRTMVVCTDDPCTSG